MRLCTLLKLQGSQAKEFDTYKVGTLCTLLKLQGSQAAIAALRCAGCFVLC